MKKLAATKVDITNYRSSKSLGATKESKREKLSRALREEQAGLDIEGDNHEILFEERATPPGDLELNDFNADVEPVRTAASPNFTTDTPQAVVMVDLKPSAVIGSGLKRPLEVAFGGGLKKPFELDENGRPILPKRKKSKTKAQSAAVVLKEPEWTGFDSQSGSEEEDAESEATQPESSDSDFGYDDISDASVDEDEGENTEGEEEGSSEEEDEEDRDEAKLARKARSSGFKAWATQQLNEALDYKPASSVLTISDSVKKSFHPRPAEHDPLPPELQPNGYTKTKREVFSVPVSRSEETQKSRMQLPVVAEEQKIMEAIHNNGTVVIWGATGSGKTTQVPQFLYEAGYGSPDGPTPGMIGVTQPRRVAAVSMAKRVGDELGSDRKKVSYQIRFEGTVDAGTAIKFMTDGVLLREVATDIALRKYSAIIIDEAHERSINTDILIGMMSRVVKLREELSLEDPSIKPLKLIIMSATLRISDFTQNTTLFPEPPPLLQAEGRQHPVSTHFARKTNREYVDDAFKKISRGHRKLPPGGMLIFLTGQNEITQLSKRLKEAFSNTKASKAGKEPSVKILGREAPVEAEDIDLGDLNQHTDRVDEDTDEITGLDDYDSSDEEDDIFDHEDEEDAGEPMEATTPMHVLPLYSLLPTKEQMRVFDPPPDGSRLIVLATNVAETSLTIPGIRYVFDCGRVKERKYDKVTGVQSFEVGWISKASASQRAGRAGRTGPGHCYRLYSSAVYERDFEEYAQPEILRMPIEGIVLQLKSMNLKHVVNFPFPTPPERQSLSKAEKLLSYLGALDSSSQLTELGRTMSVFPLSPRFAKILIIGHQHNCLPYIIAIVAALSVGEVFIADAQLDLRSDDTKPKALSAKERDENEDIKKIFTQDDRLEEDAKSARRKAYNSAHRRFSALDPQADALKLLCAVSAYEHETNQVSFCTLNFLRLKALQETHLLRRQITEIVRTNSPGAIGGFEAKLKPPTSLQVKVIKQILAAGFVDQVAIRADLHPTPPSSLDERRKPRRAIETPYLTLFPSSLPFKPSDDDELPDPAVYIHPSSSLSDVSPQNMPPYIIYAHLQQGTTKTRMKPLTPISGAQLAALAHGTPLVTYGKPIKEVPPRDLESNGKVARREAWCVPSIGGTGGGMGWPLPARKVVQSKVAGGGGWVVEEVV
jgi:ATP-dependent RNA helicase DHX37/DHR1